MLWKTIKQDKGEREDEKVDAILLRSVRKPLSDKVIFEQRHGKKKKAEGFKLSKCQNKADSSLRH